MEKRFFPLRRFALALGLMVLLGGCRTTMDNYFKELFNPSAAAKPTEAQPRQTRWCYRTLAKVECYTKPQPHQAERLVAVDPPALTPSSREDYAQSVMQSAAPSK